MNGARLQLPLTPFPSFAVIPASAVIPNSSPSFPSSTVIPNLIGNPFLFEMPFMAPRLRDTYTNMGGRATQDAKVEDDVWYNLPKSSGASSLPF